MHFVILKHQAAVCMRDLYGVRFFQISRTDYAYVIQIMQHKSMLINMGFTVLSDV